MDKHTLDVLIHLYHEGVTMEFVSPSEYETPPTSDIVTSAVSYIQRNWRVIPIHSIGDKGGCTCGNAQCSSKGKHPRTKNGVKDATNEYAKVLDWWQHDPHANIGIATGNGLLVIDIDPRHDGSLKDLDNRFNLPLTAQVTTGGGGWHLYYRYNPRIYTLSNTANKLGPGIDSRGENGYVLAPPSLHASGKRYAWRVNGPLADAPVSLLQELLKPRPIIRIVTPPPPPPTHVVPPLAMQSPLAEPPLPTATPSTTMPPAPPPAAVQPPTCIPEGQRNTALFSYAAALRRQGADEQVLLLLLDTLNKGFCQPPLSDKEVRQICSSAARGTPEERQSGIDEIVAFETLLSSELPEPQWAVPGFLPEGVTLLAGKPKMGKSWLALDLALAVAQGGTALGSLPTRGGHVLYLGLEDSRRRMYDRGRKLLGALAPPRELTYTGIWAPLHEGGLTDLETWLQQQQQQVRLVIIDTLARVRPAGTGQVYADDYAVVTPLKQLAERHHIAILLIHHLRKSSATDVMDEVSGTTGLTGAVDCIMVLQRERGQRQATLTITGRDVQDQSLNLTFDEDTARWSLKPPRAPRPLSAERQAILDLFVKEGRPLSPTEIARTLDKSRGYVAKTIHHMVKQGLLQAVQRGLYEPVPEDEREEGTIGGNIGNKAVDQPVELLEGITWE